MKPNLPHLLRKKQYLALCIFSLLIIGLQIAFYYYQQNSKSNLSEIELIKPQKTTISLSDFDPNDLNEKQWLQLGFTQKQIKTILKYKEIVGGSFNSKEQFKKCYAVSEEKYNKLEPYLLLPETAFNKDFNTNYNYKNKEKKELKINQKFNPDFYTTSDWQKIGFSDKQAAAIVKYKSYLGGSFVSKEKFRECFIINDENYNKLARYIILPEKTPENFQQNTRKIAFAKPSIKYFDFDPNQLPIDGWQKLGFSEKQAQVIINYRDKNLKGSFKSLEDIEKCFVISAEKYNELKPYIKLSASENTLQKTPNTSTKITVSKTDFSKTDLNKITFTQLIEFGFDEKAAGSFIGFRKKLGGFVNRNQILETYNIDKNLTEKLLSISSLDVTSIQKYNITDAPEEWLKNHPYFKYYADKIIYFRVSYTNEKEIFKKIKPRTEDETKMRLYLK